MVRTILAMAMAVGVMLLASPNGTRAETAEESAGMALLELEKGDYVTAIHQLRRAMMTISDESPLTASYYEFVSEPADIYANYTVRKNNVFKVGEPLVIYVEPMGYSFKGEGEKLTFGIEADFSLIDSNGTVLGGQNKFQRFKRKSFAPIFDFFMTLTYSFTGLEPGKYTVRTVLHDIVDKETDSFDMEFIVK